MADGLAWGDWAAAIACAVAYAVLRRTAHARAWSGPRWLLLIALVGCAWVMLPAREGRDEAAVVLAVLATFTWSAGVVALPLFARDRGRTSRRASRRASAPPLDAPIALGAPSSPPKSALSTTERAARRSARSRMLAAFVGTLPASLALAACFARYAPLRDDWRLALAFAAAFPTWIAGICLVPLFSSGLRAWSACAAVLVAACAALFLG